MSWKGDMGGWLLAGSFATALGTDLTLGQKAEISKGDGPIVSFNPTAGPGTTETHDRVGNPYQNVAGQFVVRATKSTIAETRAKAILTAIIGIRNQTIGSAFYLWIRPVQGDVIDIGVDNLGRARWAFNVQARKTYS